MRPKSLAFEMGLDTFKQIDKVYHINEQINGESPFWLCLLARTTLGLQGFLNVLSHTRPHIISLRKHNKGHSWFRAFIRVAMAGGDSDASSAAGAREGAGVGGLDGDLLGLERLGARPRILSLDIPATASSAALRQGRGPRWHRHRQNDAGGSELRAGHRSSSGFGGLPPRRALSYVRPAGAAPGPRSCGGRPT